MPTSHSSAGLQAITPPTTRTAEELARRSSGMTGSIDRIMTTHVGSLPRSQAVTEVLFAREREESRDNARDDAVITAAVAEVVRRRERCHATLRARARTAPPSRPGCAAGCRRASSGSGRCCPSCRLISVPTLQRYVLLEV